MAKETITSIKKKIWNHFSRYIRLSQTDKDGYGVCVTCKYQYEHLGHPKKPERLHYKKLQCGHAIGGRYNSIIFNEDVCNVQCYACNVMLHGNYNTYSLYMIDKYGRAKWQKLQALKWRTVKFTKNDLKMLLEKYKVLALEKEKSL